MVTNLIMVTKVTKVTMFTIVTMVTMVIIVTEANLYRWKAGKGSTMGPRGEGQQILLSFLRYLIKMTESVFNIILDVVD